MAASKTKKSASVVSKTARSRECEEAKSTFEAVKVAHAVLDLKIKAHAEAVSAAYFTP